MWIRSQNKEEIIKVGKLSIEVHIQKYCVVEVISSTEAGTACVNLGAYSTKEKAIKVLDMIQEFIEGQKLMMDIANSSSIIKQYVNSTETKVFQMPQDNEVLV